LLYGLLILLFVLEFPLLLDVELRLLSLFFIAFILFAGSTHNYFSFRIHDLLLNVYLQ